MEGNNGFGLQKVICPGEVVKSCYGYEKWVNWVLKKTKTKTSVMSTQPQMED